jgi:hypothetical protein
VVTSLTTFSFTLRLAEVVSDETESLLAAGAEADMLPGTNTGIPDLTVTIEAANALPAIKSAARLLHAAHGPLIVKVEEDLVSTADIAVRLALSRETVRKWSMGERRSDFPLPFAVVGDGSKVWAWGDVNEWATQRSIGEPDDVHRLTSSELYDVNAWLVKHSPASRGRLVRDVA